MLYAQAISSERGFNRYQSNEEHFSYSDWLLLEVTVFVVRGSSMLFALSVISGVID